MTRRILLTLLAGVTTAGVGSAFAPAPVYREPPKPTLEQAMQGTWGRSANTKGKGNREMRLRIEGKTWTMNPSAPGGAGRKGLAYEILLDSSRGPASLDLKHPTRPVGMKGIVKVEGDRLIFCYVRTESGGDRPKAFDDTRTPAGLRVSTMTFIRSESSAPSP